MTNLRCRHDQDGLMIMKRCTGTDPINSDTDNDGVRDGEDDLTLDNSKSIDSDGDGFLIKKN